MTHTAPAPGTGPAAHQHTRAEHARLSRRAALARFDRMPADRHLYFGDVAELANVARSTLKHYLLMARRARAAGQPLPRGLPEPDGTDPGTKDPARDAGHGGTPRSWYYPATIRPWIAALQPPGRPRANGGAPVRRTLTPAKPGPKPRRLKGTP